MNSSDICKNKSKNRKFAFVIPVYNHEQQVASVVRRALKTGIPVFVVDDGSTDSTYDRIREIDGIRLLRHRTNQGKGSAIMTGFREASEIADWAITMDADGQHRPEDAVNLIRAIPDTRALIVGKREDMGHADVPWTSRFGRKFSNFWVFVSGGPRMSDSQSGFRIYPLPECMNLNVSAKRFQFEVEILVRANRNNIPVIEAPVTVIYDRNRRISHFRPFTDFLRNSMTFAGLILQRLFPIGKLTFFKKLGFFGSLNTHHRRVILRYRNMDTYMKMFALFKVLCDCMFLELNRFTDSSEPVKTIIDIGTGYGIPAAWFLEKFPAATVYGIEPDAKRVKAASEALGKRAVIEHGRAPDIPKVPEPADMAILSDMIHYLDDDELKLTLDKVHKNLRKNGRLIIRTAVPTTNRYSWMWYFENFKMDFLKIRYDYRSFDRMKHILRETGFTTEIITPSGTKGESCWFIVKKSPLIAAGITFGGSDISV